MRIRLSAIAVAAVVMPAATVAWCGESNMDSEKIIIDNSDAAFDLIDGKWNESTRDEGFEGENYLWCRGSEPWPSQGKRTSGLELVRWRFTPPRDGRYKVYAKWVASKPDDRATDAPYSIMHRDGETVVRMNQADLSLAGKWNLLGEFDFAADSKAQVILNTNADNSVVADAVMFEYAGEASPRPAAPSVTPPAAEDKPGRLVFFDNFSGGLDKWIIEGPGEVEIRDGALRIKPLPMPGIYAWMKHKAPAAFRLEYDVTPLSESGFWLLGFCGNTVEGDMFDQGQTPREGVFNRYTRSDEFRYYHITYRRNRAGDCNLRKCPHMELLGRKAGVGTLEKGEPHHVVLTYRDGHINLEVDGRTFMDATDDDSPHGEGYIAVRNVYDSESLYDNVALYDISE